MRLTIYHSISNQFLQSFMIVTHLLSRRVGPHLVEGLIERPGVDLGDGTHSVVEAVRSTGMLADNLRVKAGGNAVTHIRVEHIELGGMR